MKPESVERKFQIEIANENLRKAFESRVKYQNGGSRVELKIGDLVLLRVPHLSDASQKKISKFYHLFEGPYRLHKQIGNNAFVLVNESDSSIIKGTYNRAGLRKYFAGSAD